MFYFSYDVKLQSIPIQLITTAEFEAWQAQQSTQVQEWLRVNDFIAKPDTFCILPNEQGSISQVVFCVEEPFTYWSIGLLAQQLPAGRYSLERHATLLASPLQWQHALMAWGLASYRTDITKRPGKLMQLVLSESTETRMAQHWIDIIYWVRDLINTPCEQLGPTELATAASELANIYAAECKVYSGTELLTAHYPAVYAVGRASSYPPCLIDLRWGNLNAPKITLVGKGVCFDSGGLNIKNTPGMRTMKKDMGGAAHVLGLAKMIMSQQLPIRLRVLIPAVENAIDGSSYRPGDILNTRSGMRVEITNTDAEGRVILGDAITAAIEDEPELLIDIATLTGAARVALGPEVPVFFCNQEELSKQLEQAAVTECDPIWRLPLYAPYKRHLKSDIADCCNAPYYEYAGAITAALYLQQFVNHNIPWAHFDIMAWNDAALPGRYIGGEVMAIRGIFNFLQQRYG